MKLTLPQQDVYFEQLLYPNDAIYNIGAKIKIEGVLDVILFEKAYRELIFQHDTFRTIFKSKEDTIIAEIQEEQIKELEHLDFSICENANDTAIDFMEREFVRPFNILCGSPLHKFILIKVSEQMHYLFSVYHHIITDGWGTSLMFQRLVKNYNELLEFNKIIFQYPFNYKDFVTDDYIYQNSDAFNEDKTYWLNRFNTIPENLFEKTNITFNNKSSRKVMYLKRNKYNDLEVLAKRFNVTNFHLILSLLYIYFGRKNQNKDFAIGLPILNRGKSVFKKTVGLFMGVSPLRIEINYESSFVDFITSVKNQLRQDYRHQRFPLGKIIQGLNSFQEKEKIFNITLSFEKQNYSDHFGNTKTTVIPLTHKSERVALAIYIREFDENENVKIDFDYNLNYFDEESITSVTAHFQTIIDDIIQNPDKKLFELIYLSEEEKNKLIVNFNDTQIQFPKERIFLDFFYEKCQKYPEKIAIKDNTSSLSYKELHNLSDKIARSILNEGNEITSVGVLLDRSAETIAVLIGILKAGKSYIPIDPTFPYDRLQYIVNHSGLKIIISNYGNIFEKFKDCKILILEEVLKDRHSALKVSLPKVLPNSTAYIIYTSGSTGNPKGVEIGHQSLINFLLSMQQKLGIKESDLFFAVTTYSFDISILEFFVPLISGATVYITNNETLADYSKIITAIKDINPSIIQATPSFFQLLINGEWLGYDKLKILCGGDLLSRDLAEKLLQNSEELWNMYGPTETTIWSSIKQIKNSQEASNIGKPIANTQFYVLDEYKQLLPIASAGILYIAGDGLAKGYFKDLELTASKFVYNPFGEGLLYNTNDVVKWNKKGEIIFLGRNDSQVKIRGYRVELEDIEIQLNAIPEIQKAIVVAKKQQVQDTFLVAYIIKKFDHFDVQKCISILKEKLPLYMVPHVFVDLEEFPLTPNKKIDRNNLSQRTIKLEFNLATATLVNTPLQMQLEDYWRDVLEYQEKISIHENFFALGGHSLNAVKLIHIINTQLNYNIGLKSLFDYPTIELLADHLLSLKSDNVITIPFAKQNIYYNITPSQYELWIACQDIQKSIAYNMVSVFEVDGILNPDKINEAVFQLISKNEILRTNFTEINGKILQKISPEEKLTFNLTVLQAKKEEVHTIIQEYIEKPFDFEYDLLLKTLFINTSLSTSLLIFCTHHIIMDGASLEYLSKEFATNYINFNSLTKKTDIQFKDYAEWLYLNGNSEKNLEFWKNYLQNYTVKESFARDFNFYKKLENGSHFHEKFTKNETHILKQFAQQQKTTPHNVIVAIINVLIYKLSDHSDIVMGTVNSGRNTPDIYRMTGMFVKTLPLRIKLHETMNFLDILSYVQENILLIDEHQDLPLQFKKGTLFDILVTYQNPDFSIQETIQIGDVKLKYLPIDTNYSRLSLLFNFFEIKDKLKLTISYDTNKYEESSIEFILYTYKKLLSQIIQNPDLKLSEIQYQFMNIPNKNKTNFDFNF